MSNIWLIYSAEGEQDFAYYARKKETKKQIKIKRLNQKEIKPFASVFALRDQGYKNVNTHNEQNLAHCLYLIVCSSDRQLIDLPADLFV
ncbi:hypothetical protein ACKB4K_001696 [Vibrio vulnificus]|uniref:hypothetical protein n=1 Tax=Vibrio vulnificus TaxID=672 RepID=UPI0005F24A0C|nr:hypothetical protein [Vibrio vulnificus]ELP1875560.1 hypothetical protein [Vibrio vulnificus]ELU4007608.1 hypothetical protein [Vibrio vulnificus]MCA3912441.1 hypothetical protein [Vibrio vulnificus]MCG8702911.1 hypothetical protein [Vibrio vulnificus]RZQ44105.1 hypothetical protein D8T55_09925 [Vibrio vulnificus]